MLGTLLITLLIVAICIVLLGVKVFFVKGGRFPNGHVSGNKAMRDRGIGCVQSQDRDAQKKSRFSIDELEKQKQEFQTKYQNNAYLSQERAQQEYNRIAKLEQDLQNLSNKLQSELMSENEKNSLQLRDSINAFLKEYNKTKGYSMIISNTGFDNLLYADSVYNITREILDGLNARYSSPVKK